MNSPASMNILVLDTCRTNAFEVSEVEWFRRLARMPPHKNCLIAFSTWGGEQASDGPVAEDKSCLSRTGNGPYASCFVDLMEVTGLEIREALPTHQQGVCEALSETCAGCRGDRAGALSEPLV